MEQSCLYPQDHDTLARSVLDFVLLQNSSHQSIAHCLLQTHSLKGDICTASRKKLVRHGTKLLSRSLKINHLIHSAACAASGMTEMREGAATRAPSLLNHLPSAPMTFGHRGSCDTSRLNQKFDLQRSQKKSAAWESLEQLDRTSIQI